ncbi:MAG TPA: OsmC family protein [Cytophagales bacterium]|nr:OsmC family protein [Cytophagales bacterium]
MATAKIIYQGGLRNKAVHLASGQEILTDAPTDNHGKGEAFSPTDLTAMSLGACIITTMGIAGKKENIDYGLDDTELEITKIMSQDAPRRIAEIQVKITFSNKNLSSEHKAKLEKIAHSCPVALSLHPDIKQAITFVW